MLIAVAGGEEVVAEGTDERFGGVEHGAGDDGGLDRCGRLVQGLQIGAQVGCVKGRLGEAVAGQEAGGIPARPPVQVSRGGRPGRVRVDLLGVAAGVVVQLEIGVQGRGFRVRERSLLCGR
ncbi:hypothetical protein AB0469_01350 [Streptomyces sp. NPDC093801]|uniref:hypothetical protein n=1 Tax=Streptomyces sp. NPDC093801 TaxID=3155203 RepID=UPI00344FB01F